MFLPILSGLSSTGSFLTNLFTGFDQQKAQKEALEQQAQYMQKATDLADEQLQFFKGQQDAWESVFGSIQDNLSGFYKNLSPESVAAKNIQNLEMEFNRASTQVNEQLAKRGLSNSGASVAANANLAQNLAYQRAEARSNAGFQVAQAQQDYLANIGLPQRGQNLASLGASYQGLANAYQNQANFYGQQAGQAGQAAASSFAGAGSALGSAAGNIAIASALGGGEQSKLSSYLAGTPSTTPTFGVTKDYASVYAPISSGLKKNSYDYELPLLSQYT